MTEIGMIPCRNHNHREYCVISKEELIVLVFSESLVYSHEEEERLSKATASLHSLQESRPLCIVSQTEELSRMRKKKKFLKLLLFYKF